MSVSVCKPCGATFRKGKRVLVPDGNGRLVGQIVCPSCANQALRILPAGGITCAGCSARPAEWCAICVDEAMHRTVTKQLDRVAVVKELRALARAYPDNHGDSHGEGIGAGLRMAADKLEGGSL